MKNLLNKLFKLEDNGTTILKEIEGGVVTFFAMCYILFLNPIILGNLGLKQEQIFTATAITAIVGCLMMAFVANKPLGIAPGMGLNNIFALTICIANGFSFFESLSICFLAGIVYLILTITNFRNKIIKAIPDFLKKAMSAGIGLFIAVVGLTGAGLIAPNPNTIFSLGDLSLPTAWIALFGLVVIMVLNALHVNGAIIISILLSTLFGIILTISGLNTGITFNGVVSLPMAPPAEGFIEGFKTLDFSKILQILAAIFSVCFVAMFNVTGMIGASSSHLNYKDDKDVKRVLLADSMAFMSSSMLGSSPATIFGETMSGIEAGARTGFANLITAILFVLALFFSPLLSVITPQITAPVLVMIGVMLMANTLEINWHDYKEAIPAFLTIFLMPMTYSIINGIAFGILAYILLKSISYRKKEGTSFFKEIPPILLIIAVMFILNFILEYI